jgi:hypothetical protein
MTAQTPDRLQAVMETLESVNTSVDELATTASNLVRDGRRNRLLVTICLIGGFLLACVTAAVIVLGVLAIHNGATIADVRSSDIASCQASNQTRANEVSLWTKLYAGAKKTQHLTPAQRKADDAFIAYVEKTFAPRPCRAEYRIP